MIGPMEELERPAYTEEHAVAYPQEYLAGIDLYNAGEFHAAHDAWEERWRDHCGPREKLFLQALIQSAVIFHHIEIGRRGAARRMYGVGGGGEGRPGGGGGGVVRLCGRSRR